MRIGIDIDGVLTDISRFYLDYRAKFALENNIDEIADPNGYEIEDILNLEKECIKNFGKSMTIIILKQNILGNLHQK